MRGYVPPAGYYDEFLGGNGQPRPHWDKIAKQFAELGPEDLQRKQHQLSRLIHDNGITYNVYRDAEADNRPWSMDMLPLVLSENEFSKLESALSQRAHLLNLILRDVYGRQTMLQGSKMHPFLVFGNPSFLRPCHGLLPPRANHIHLYAADLARSPDGSWWVLADRVEAASGLGYAMENRMLMSRLFPKIARDNDVTPLQPFIQEFCEHVESLAPRNRDNPNVALLTAGPHNETYFEQSFLARNLGYTLAEGDDLTIRDNRLYMKTIGGVQPVDVLLRRVDSAWTDPLELRNESLLGVPGLVNAVRNGNLAVANGLGSGFVETSAMLAFLPWFCRSYLGENLELPSVATWWCGQVSEKKYVLENLTKLAVKPTFWGGNSKTYFGPLMSTGELDELRRMIEKHPEQFCGQEIVSHATIPVMKGNAMDSRHFLLRVFLIPSKGGWKIMPGGLARFSATSGEVTVSMQSGGESKDTWVPLQGTKKPRRHETSKSRETIQIRRNSNDLPSRTANNLFWLGRYIERSESLTRLIHTTCSLIIDETLEAQSAAIPFIEQVMPVGSDSSKLLIPETGELNLPIAEGILIKAIYEQANPESLISNLHAIARSAEKVKDRLSTDTWKQVQKVRRLGTSSLQTPLSVTEEDNMLLLERILAELTSFAGNVMDNMTRSQGWRFLQLGRKIERGLSIAFLLKSAFSSKRLEEERMLSYLLIWADSVITYRRRYLNHLQPSSVMDLLCFDASNPRSLAFQAENLRELLALLPHASESRRHPIDQHSLRLFSRIGLGDPQALIRKSRKSGNKEMEHFFSDTIDDLTGLSGALEQTYFAHIVMVHEQQSQTFIG
jgi:uncharacterized circularly permuted ATP-grasp superfamily protein/uncharacterized alpha-E superfamily protein